MPLNDYGDFNDMLVLSNGNIVILTINKAEKWSYQLYNTNMQLIKEINSTISKEYYPERLKEVGKHNIECIFYIDHVNKKDCILQAIQLF